MSNDNFINYLRDEARDLKDCFTQFSFKVIGLSAIWLGLLTKYQMNHPYLGYSGVLIVFMALSVGRVGIYKYSNANRIAGYELFMDRRKRFYNTPGWNDKYTDIGWEEALRAWRTIQPTIFQYYYEFGPNRINILKEEHQDIKYKWFNPKTLHKPGSVYYTGNYLKTMLSILYITSWLGISSMVFMMGQFYSSDQVFHLILSIIATIAVVKIYIDKSNHLTQRRILLQEGILSIHSCAITWQLVVVAHHRAIQRLDGYDQNTGMVDCLFGYTEKLSELSIELRDHLKRGGCPQSWVNKEMQTKIENES